MQTHADVRLLSKYAHFKNLQRDTFTSYQVTQAQDALAISDDGDINVRLGPVVHHLVSRGAASGE